MTKHYKFFKTPDDKRGAEINKAVRERVKNSKVLELLLPDKKSVLPGAAKLRASVRSAGITDCPFVAYLERNKLRQRCAATGDADLCYRVGELYAKHKIYPGEEREQVPAHFERACVNGSTKACARRAAWSGGSVRWLERACRRGHKPSCERLAIDKPASPTATLIVVTPKNNDEVVAKVKKLYLASIIDCFEAYAQGRKSTAKGKIAFTFRTAANGVADVRTNAFDEGVAKCIKKQISRWAFAGANSATRYHFCYEMKGKSMLSRRRMVPGLLAAIGRGQAKRRAPRFGMSRRRRVAKPKPRRRYATVSVYYGTRVGPATTLSRYVVNRQLNKRRYYIARCFERHVMKGRYASYTYAYVDLSISKTGSVSSARVSSVTRYHSNTKWKRCIESAVARTKFKAPMTNGTRTPTTTAFRRVRLYFGTTYYKPYKANICDFEAF